MNGLSISPIKKMVSFFQIYDRVEVTCRWFIL
ncbi:hypothetical protein PsAD13_01736 [Pseudovibrio sp. Ad13]|nr:hypothetical protein PsAD13_01736 [Pseudovibrio sp. Ad13]